MGVLIGPNTLYYVIVRPKGKLREDFDFSDEKVRKPALLRPEMGERGTGDMATTVIAITNQKGGVGKTTTAAALLTGLHRRRRIRCGYGPAGESGVQSGAGY
jgi:chromosome partitioning protein